MTYRSKIDTQIKKLTGYSENEIVCLGSPLNSEWVHRNEISLTMLHNLLKAGWLAIPF